MKHTLLQSWPAILILIALGLVGQLAWTIENMYLNLFVYNTILADAVQGQFVEPGQYRRELVLAGYGSCLAGQFSGSPANLSAHA